MTCFFFYAKVLTCDARTFKKFATLTILCINFGCEFLCSLQFIFVWLSLKGLFSGSTIRQVLEFHLLNQLGKNSFKSDAPGFTFGPNSECHMWVWSKLDAALLRFTFNYSVCHNWWQRNYLQFAFGLDKMDKRLANSGVFI